MADGINRVAVFIEAGIIPFDVEQVILQLCLQPGVLQVGGSDVLVGCGVGSREKGVESAYGHLGAAGKGIEDQHDNKEDADNPQKNLAVPGNESGSLLQRILRFFRGLYSGLSRLLNGFHTFSGFGRSVFLLDGLLLLPAGYGIGGEKRLFTGCPFLKQADIGLVQLLLRFQGFSLRFQCMGAVRILRSADGAFSGSFQAVGSLHADIVIFGSGNLSVDLRSRQGCRSGLQSGGCFLHLKLFKLQLHRLFHGAKGNARLVGSQRFCLGLFCCFLQLIRSLVQLLSGFMKFQAAALLLGELKPGNGAFGFPGAHVTPP